MQYSRGEMSGHGDFRDTGTTGREVIQSCPHGRIDIRLRTWTAKAFAKHANTHAVQPRPQGRCIDLHGHLILARIEWVFARDHL